MTQHRALRAAGGARGVHDCGEIIVVPVNRWFQRRDPRGSPGIPAQVVEARDPHTLLRGGLLAGQFTQRIRSQEAFGLHNHQSRPGVLDKVAQLNVGVAGVERHVNGALAQYREVQPDHVDVLVELYGDPIADPYPCGVQRRGELHTPR